MPLNGELTGVRISASSESMRYCGVCTRDAVAHAGAPVQQLRGRNLAARTQRDQQAGGHVALRQSHLPRLAAVHVDVDHRVVHHLVNVDVRRARECASPSPAICRAIS